MGLHLRIGRIDMLYEYVDTPSIEQFFILNTPMHSHFMFSPSPRRQRSPICSTSISRGGRAFAPRAHMFFSYSYRYRFGFFSALHLRVILVPHRHLCVHSAARVNRARRRAFESSGQLLSAIYQRSNAFSLGNHPKL